MIHLFIKAHNQWLSPMPFRLRYLTERSHAGPTFLIVTEKERPTSDDLLGDLLPRDSY